MIAPSTQSRASTEVGVASAADAVLANMLIATWALRSGRCLRNDVPPDQLEEAELIEFWYDEKMIASPTATLKESVCHPLPRAGVRSAR